MLSRILKSTWLFSCQNLRVTWLSEPHQLFCHCAIKLHCHCTNAHVLVKCRYWLGYHSHSGIYTAAFNCQCRSHHAVFWYSWSYFSNDFQVGLANWSITATRNIGSAHVIDLSTNARWKTWHGNTESESQYGRSSITRIDDCRCQQNQLVTVTWLRGWIWQYRVCFC